MEQQQAGIIAGVIRYATELIAAIGIILTIAAILIRNKAKHALPSTSDTKHFLDAVRENESISTKLRVDAIRIIEDLDNYHDRIRVLEKAETDQAARLHAAELSITTLTKTCSDQWAEINSLSKELAELRGSLRK